MMWSKTNVVMVWLTVVFMVTGLCGSAISDDKKPEIKASKSPTELYAQWSAKEAADADKMQAIASLKRLLRDDPESDASKEAFDMLLKIHETNRSYEEIISLCENRIPDASDPDAHWKVINALSAAYVGQRQYDEAADLLSDYLGRESADGKWSDKCEKAAASLVSACRSASRHDKIVEVCVMQLQHENDPTKCFSIITTLSSAYTGLQDHKNAAGVLDTFLQKNRADIPTSSVLSACRTVSAIYADQLSDPKKAVDILTREIEALSPDDMLNRSGLLALRAVVYSKNLEDDSKAEADLREIISLDTSSSTTAKAYRDLIQLYSDSRHPERVVDTMLEFIQSPSYTPSTGFADVQQMLDSGATPQQLEQAAWALKEKIATALAAPATIDQLQPSVVRFLFSAGQKQEALQEARVYVCCCSEKSIPAAVDLAAWVLKSTDMNLVRANQFLRYQKFGPEGEDGKLGTADDLSDVLREIEPVNDPRRTDLGMKSINTLPRDWTGFRSRGDIYAWLDKPVDAFQSYKKSFELCPLSETELQATTDVLTGHVIRNVKDVPLAEVLVEFTMFGPAGKDAKSGTADDLKDPTIAIIEKLQYSISEPTLAATPPPQPEQAEIPEQKEN